MKKILIPIALASLFLTSCSTSYMNYQGGKVQQGAGGACVNVKGVDIWTDGTPPRKFQVIGVINDGRPDGPIPMAGRNNTVADVVKQHGGDAAILSSEGRDFQGTVSTGSSVTNISNTAYGTPSGANALAYGNTFGSGTSIATYRRNSKYYVIKYL